jgi:tetratricopeptide (TPR) repeat protein
MDGAPPTEDSRGGLDQASATPSGPAEGGALHAPEVVPSSAPELARTPGPDQVGLADPAIGQPSRPAAGEDRPTPAAPAGLAAAFETHPEEAKRLKSAQPRGASDAQLDQLRATVKISARGTPSSPSRPSSISRSQPPLTMNTGELTLLLEEGRALLDQKPEAAHQKFEAAYRRNLNDVRVLSYYGLTLVVVDGDRQRGIRFCEEAARRGPLTTELLVNLAKALVLTRNKEQAVRALRKAQDLAPDDPRIGREFLALGLRRKPPIAFLPRSFFLNRWIGMLTWRFAREKDPFGTLP